MSFVKKHINKFVALGIIALVVAALLILKGIFFPAESKAIYGNRLEGRNKVKVTNEEINKVKSDLAKDSSSVNVRIAGRIIYIDVVVKDDVSKDKAKEMFGSTVNTFSAKEQSYYDIQVIMDNKANQDQFPIIGYKHHTKSSISWTKDR